MWMWTNTRARAPQPDDVMSLPPDGAQMNGINPSAVNINSLDHNLRFVLIRSIRKLFDPSDEIAFNRYDQRLDAGVRTIALCQTEFGDGCDTDDLAYVWRHPDWNFNTAENDVALIFLPAAQRISPKFIRPVKLNRNPNVPADGQDLEAFGWGATCLAPFPPDPIVAPATDAPTPTPECIDDTYPNEIQTGNLRYLTNQVCSTLPEIEGPITPDMMCAKTNSDRGVSIAFGDSGTCNSLSLAFVFTTTKDDFTPMPHSSSTIRRATCNCSGIRRNTSSRCCQLFLSR